MNSGCFKKGNIPPQKLELSGKRFSKLSVIKRSDKVNNQKNGHSYWDCKCDCGQSTIVKTSMLTKGHTKSCGCLKDRRGKNSPRYRGVETMSGSYINNISQAAKNTGKEWNVNKEYLYKLYEKQDYTCILSGLPIKFGNGRRDIETTASLDRIDNSKGYVEGNLQWVHKEINKMRGKLEVSQFINLCRYVAVYNPRMAYREYDNGSKKEDEEDN